MERKLQKCRVCGEWFNTTSAVMVAHYRLRHQKHFDKVSAIAELIAKREVFTMQAKTAPFPLSVQFAAAAALAHIQLGNVIAHTE